MKKETALGEPKQDWLKSVNKPRGSSKSLSPYDNPERTSNWLLKQITGNISAAVEKSELEEKEVLQVAEKALQKAKGELE